jgi:hypothetical protein
MDAKIRNCWYILNRGFDGAVERLANAITVPEISYHLNYLFFGTATFYLKERI